MNKVRIDKKDNIYQHIEVLKNNRKKRGKYGKIFVEGAKSINNIFTNGWAVESLIYPYDCKLSDWAQDIINSSNATQHIEISSSLMADLSDKEEGSEILAIVMQPKDDLERIKTKEDMIIVLLDRPSNHGNLGSIIRSCEALGVDGIIISGHAVDLYDTKTIRSSMGTVFSVPIVRVDSPDEVENYISEIKTKYPRFKVLGTTANTEKVVEEVDMCSGVALLIGNETTGLSYKYKSISDELVKIRMYGRITSFNVACATSIMIYEIDRQRNVMNSR